LNGIFTDPGLEEEFRRTGYVVRPLLSAAQVAAITDRFHALMPNQAPDYDATPRSRDTDYRWAVFETIRSSLQETVATILPGYRACLGAFISKAAGSEKSRVWLHQDYTFADPAEHTAVHIWVPLVDVDEHNGCLKVVAGSHTFFDHISATPQNPSPYKAVVDTLDAHFCTQLPMAAGSALIYDGRLLHGSDNNRSTEFRLALGSSWIPQTVASRLYCWNETNPRQLDYLDVTEEFLAKQLRPGSPVPEPYPDGVGWLGRIDYDPRPCQEKDLIALRQLQSQFSGDDRVGSFEPRGGRLATLVRAVTGRA